MNRPPMRLCVETLLATVLTACLSLPAAAATLYRWVDEKGTVNYSSEAPSSGGGVQTVTQHSMAGYDGAAALAASERQNRELQARLDRLQREVEELKQAQSAPPPPVAAQAMPQAVPVQTTANPCSGDPRSNCSRGYSPEYDYVQVIYPPVVVVRPRPLPPFYVVPPVATGKPVSLSSTLPSSHKHHHSTQATSKPAPGLPVNYRAGSAARTQY